MFSTNYVKNIKPLENVDEDSSDENSIDVPKSGDNEHFEKYYLSEEATKKFNSKILKRERKVQSGDVILATKRRYNQNLTEIYQ